jgi:hypothetical protein
MVVEQLGIHNRSSYIVSSIRQDLFMEMSMGCESNGGSTSLREGKLLKIVVRIQKEKYSLVGVKVNMV